MSMTEDDLILQAHEESWGDATSNVYISYCDYTDKILVQLTKRVLELEEELNKAYAPNKLIVKTRRSR